MAVVLLESVLVVVVAVGVVVEEEEEVVVVVVVVVVRGVTAMSVRGGRMECSSARSSSAVSAGERSKEREKAPVGGL